MATQAVSSPVGVPMQNGVNDGNNSQQSANHSFAQTPVLLPSYAPSSQHASAISGPQRQGSSASPAHSAPFIPPGQHRSPSGQPHTTAQNGNAMQPKPPHTQAQGLMSPPTNQQSSSVESQDYYQELVNLIERAPAPVVRQVVRDKWEKSLAGSQYHIAFLLNATMHQASPETVAKAVKEFGAGLVQKSKRELISHLGMSDLDELVDLILPRASPEFLDRALARRLETIPARQLVNALARAERLGYDVHDIVHEHNERVIPTLQSMPTQSTPMPPVNQALRVKHYHQPVPTQGPSPTVPNQGTLASTTHAPQMNLPPSPPGLVWCRCGWPCSSKESFEYHLKKNACHKVQENDIPGRDICLYCGCRFGSGGGLLYHEKSNVCGDHNYELGQKMRALIDAYRAQNQSLSAAVPKPPVQVSSTPSTQVHSSASQPQMGWVASTPSEPAGTPGRGQNRNPYSHLNPETLKKFKEIMRNAEAKYGGLMQEASLLDEPERSRRLASLKNSYNTKQSTTRKKFGIRLRERRTRGEIEAEEARLFGTTSGNMTPSYGTPVPDSDSRPNKRPRTDDDEQLESLTGPNGDRESPRKRVPVSEMGGLSGSQATAELTDPTAHLNRAQPRYMPQKPAMASSQPKTSESPDRTRTFTGLTQDDPMSIDDDDDDDDSPDTDSDSDGDIPAIIS
ncbi:hypothetical protein KAF25_006743 [Fusarium avenaceum]|uniref:Uncharacterized protein n=1 Tax=Fusarium avenaceum TaxID=40199 RepID=A0A9P7HD04_9HYPO|nr:hypothetical protein KAF25_006743 [Fusarium avenaceum]